MEQYSPPPLSRPARFDIVFNLECQRPGSIEEVGKLARSYHEQFHGAWCKKSNRESFFKGFLSGFTSFADIFNKRSFEDTHKEIQDRHQHISYVIEHSHANCERLAIRQIIKEYHMNEDDIIKTPEQKEWMKMKSFPEWDGYFNAVQKPCTGKPPVFS